MLQTSQQTFFILSAQTTTIGTTFLMLIEQFCVYVSLGIQWACECFATTIDIQEALDLTEPTRCRTRRSRSTYYGPRFSS